MIGSDFHHWKQAVVSYNRSKMDAETIVQKFCLQIKKKQQTQM